MPTKNGYWMSPMLLLTCKNNENLTNATCENRHLQYLCHYKSPSAYNKLEQYAMVQPFGITVQQKIITAYVLRIWNLEGRAMRVNAKIYICTK